uniref:Uncharacterized protein n=1 Tax=Arundo donax TaxID=35708 RepID=A0A0A9A4L8_ARUDO
MAPAETGAKLCQAGVIFLTLQNLKDNSKRCHTPCAQIITAALSLDPL